jgi:hypothetical protein
MTDQTQTETAPASAWGLTAEQATARLAQMTKAYQETKKSSDPVTDRYADNRGRIDRLVSGDPKELARFNELMAKKAEADPVEAVMTGALPDVPSSEHRQMNELASYMRSLGHPDAVVREALATDDAPISQELHNQLKVWKSKALSNPEWSKAYLSGSVEHRLQMESAIIALMHPIAEENAA